MSQGYTMIPAFKHAFTYHHYGHSLEIPPPFPTHNKQTQVALCNLKPDFTQAVPLESERKRLLGGFFFFLNRLPHGGGNKTNPIAGEKLTLLCPGVGKFPIRFATPSCFSHPRDRWCLRRPWTGSTLTMTEGGGKLHQAAGRPRSCSRGTRPPRGPCRSSHRLAPLSRHLVLPAPNLETARARPRSLEHPAPSGPHSRFSRRRSDPVNPETE